MFNRKKLLLQTVCAVLAVLVITQLPALLALGESFGELKPVRSAEPTLEPKSAAHPALPTNASALPPGGMPMPMPGMPMPGMVGMPGGRPASGAELPAKVKARVDFIVNSELLGPVPRPLPMALLGIAGSEALLRAPNGQMGMISAGGELGGVKLLQIGTNRILIEHEGQKKELTLFSGYGGETLLPKQKETSK